MKQNKMKTLIEYIESDLEDPRKDYNQKHKLLDIVIISITGILCGMDSWNEIEDWANSKKEWFKTFLEIPNGIPSHDTLNRVFQTLDPENFQKMFMSWTEDIAGEIKGVVAIDGKTMRGSKSRNQNASHIVSAWAHENGLALGQVKTDEKSNEITAIPELLNLLSIKGCIVTIDAMGTQKKIAETIVNENKADYILAVKKNQDTLYEEIETYMNLEILSQKKAELKKENKYYVETGKEHGRIEKRQYYIENNIEWLKERNPGWTGIKGIGMCVSTVTENDKTTNMQTYFIYSVSEMTAKKFSISKRAHWSIENSLHWVLDVAFNEDKNRTRTKNAAENSNIMRKIALSLLKQEKTCKMGLKSKRKKCSYDDAYLLKVLNILNNRA